MEEKVTPILVKLQVAAFYISFNLCEHTGRHSNETVKQEFIKTKTKEVCYIFARFGKEDSEELGFLRCSLN